MHVIDDTEHDNVQGCSSRHNLQIDVDAIQVHPTLHTDSDEVMSTSSSTTTATDNTTTQSASESSSKPPTNLSVPPVVITDTEIASLPSHKDRKRAKQKQKRQRTRRRKFDKALARRRKQYPQESEQDSIRIVNARLKRKQRKRRRPVLPTIGMIFGVLLLVFPMVSDLHASIQAEQSIASYTKTVDEMEQENKELMLAQATAHNHRIANIWDPTDVDIDDMSYDDILNVDGNGTIGSIIIDCIGVNQPIFHGTEEDTLMAGVGHLETTTFPLPTGSTHAALAGHTGMPGQRMFDELVDLEPGDKLHIKILDSDTWYQVVYSEVVEPEQKNAFLPEEGKELLTLITCTPYGINDHRLLVHCEKINVQDLSQLDFGVVNEDKISKYINLRTIPVFITVMLIILGIIWSIIKKIRKKRKKVKQEKHSDNSEDDMKTKSKSISELTKENK